MCLEDAQTFVWHIDFVARDFAADAFQFADSFGQTERHFQQGGPSRVLTLRLLQAWPLLARKWVCEETRAEGNATRCLSSTDSLRDLSLLLHVNFSPRFCILGLA